MNTTLNYKPSFRKKGKKKQKKELAELRRRFCAELRKSYVEEDAQIGLKLKAALTKKTLNW